MTPSKHLYTFGIIALLLISVTIPVLVGRRPAPDTHADAAEAASAVMAQAASSLR
jgi:hypothetical protein